MPVFSVDGEHVGTIPEHQVATRTTRATPMFQTVSA
jgi:hypothetical protein